MATESGFSNKKAYGKAQHKTLHDLGSSRVGQAIAPTYLYELTPTAIPVIGVEESDDKKTVIISIDPSWGYIANKNDILRLTLSYVIENFEFEILEQSFLGPSGNFIEIRNVGTYDDDVAPQLPEVGDEIKIFRWVTAQSDKSGNPNFSPGPTTFVKDAATQQVVEDTAVPANNKPLPTGMYFYKDGVATAVATDSITPSNTVPMPVELYGAGTTINLTAGDINIQTSSEGATFDSMRIGDGSGVYIVVNGDGSINAVTGGLTDAELRASAIPVSGPLTDAELRASAIPVSGPLTDVQLRATAVPVSAASLPLPSGAATSSKQDDLIAKLPSTIGQKVAADSLSVVLASGTALSVSSTTLATEAKQDDIINELQDIELDVEAVALKLPSTIGQKLPADSLSVVLATGSSISATITGGATEAKQDTQITAAGSTNTKLDSLLTELQLKADLTESQPVVVGALTGTYQEIVNLTTVAQTFTAPANAKWCKVYADDTNSANIRVKIGGAATISSGIQMQPGRAEDFNIAGNISVIAESGTLQKINVHFGA